MPEPDPRRVKALFDGAVELPQEQRAAFLDAQCAGDAGLRARVESLLRALQQVPEFLSAPTGATASTPASRPLSEGPGARIGPYKLLQQIGEGGFGVVFMAEQEKPVQRRVALKIIKLGMDTRQVVARFEQERQALAMMDHPNIARVFDAGATETGRPYFVMELVRGVPITEYCDTHNLSIDERLGLFEDVCRAVQHAHQKGIIHRDIKPSNVLVTIIDGRAIPKVIDFGVAKATAARLTEKTLFTEHRQLIGTPEYMSPEQAEMSAGDVDTRSDIYSLGVLLYELLTGTLPFDPTRLRSAAFGEIQRIIREEDPPKPSTRLSSLETLPSVSARRQIEPARLSRIVRGDLDWIVMKCLEKDRTRRYETADALASDLLRHQRHEPVIASPPSTTYRLNRFARRNRGIIGAGSAVALALILGAAGFAWQAHKTAIERDAAVTARIDEEHQRKRSDAISEFVQAALRSSDPNEGGRQDMPVSDAMVRAAAQLDAGEFKDDPDTEGVLRLTIARILDGNAHSAEALPQAERALKIVRAAHSTDHQEVSLALSVLATCQESLGRFDEALPNHKAAVEMAQRLAPQGNSDVAGGLNNVANCLIRLGRAAEALPYNRSALEMYQRIYPGDHRHVAMAMGALANTLVGLGRLDEALPEYRKGLEMQRRLASGDSVDVSAALCGVGDCLRSLGRAGEALPMFEEALTIDRRLFKGDHPAVSIDLNNAALCLSALGRESDALPLLQESLDMRRRLHPGDHPTVAVALNNLANCLGRLGRTEEALQCCEAAVAMSKRLFHGDHPSTANALRSLAACLGKLGRFSDALGPAQEASAMAAKVLPEGHPARKKYDDTLADIKKKLEEQKPPPAQKGDG